MRTVSYPSDLTGFQWSLIKPHLPVYPGGRPRKTDLRDVVDAIFYILRTGCQWRYLPKDFPPKSTVWRYFNQWRHNGTLETIHDLLRRKVRAAEKPYSPRTSASVDSQSVDTTSGGEQRGRDNAKNVDGRKRHIVVDSMGLLMAVLVTAASIDDAKAAAELFARLDGQPMSHVKRMYADSKYHNFILYEWVETNAAWELNIVQRPKDAVGWVLLPIRWTVERTFAWLGRCRRLSKDREKSVRSSEAFVKLAMIHLMLNRLAPKKRMPSSTIVRRHKPTCGTDTKKTTPRTSTSNAGGLGEVRALSRIPAPRVHGEQCRGSGGGSALSRIPAPRVHGEYELLRCQGNSLALPGKMKQPSLVDRSLRTSSSDQVPSVAASSHRTIVGQHGPTCSGAAVHESLRQYLEDKFLAPSWPPSDRTSSEEYSFLRTSATTQVSWP